MIQTYLKRMPELAISGAMILIMLLFSLIFNLPIIYPSGERAAFVGIHYIYPLIGVGLLGILTFFVGNRAIASRFLIALPCYAAILFAHFNIKLLIPHINPTNFDASYWALEERKSAVWGKSVSIRVVLGGRRIFKKKIHSIQR